MEFKIEPKGQNGFEAGYSCSCGCHPAVQYQRHEPASNMEHCCCGSIFLVGPESARKIGEAVKADGGAFDIQIDRFVSPWGEAMEAALAVPKS